MTSSPITLRAAMPADEAGLRALARATPVAGTVSVTLEREPLYGAGELCAIRTDTVVAERNGVFLGSGSRVIRAAWWNGRIQPTAYLTGLRVLPRSQQRVGRFLRNGFAWMADVAATHPAAVTWTVIFEANRQAQRVLEGGRAGLPQYIDRGRLICRLASTCRGGLPSPKPSSALRAGTAVDVPAIVDFHRRHHAGRPLALPLEPHQIDGPSAMPGLRIEDFLLWYERDELRGMVAVWDVRSVRQVRVASCPRWWRWLHQPARLAAALTGWPALPVEGQILAVAHASFLTIADQNLGVARRLLRAARAASRKRGLDSLCLCLHALDPLVGALRGVPGIAADGRLYEVVGPGQAPSWSDGVPVIEPAML
jgi:hypothetical protein